MICAALVTAAGEGKRMGRDVPKQYLELRGIPILARTLLAFENHPLIDLIVITVPSGHEELCRTRIVTRFNLGKVKEIVAGGTTRQASVYNGLLRLGKADMVAIHDGVRPLVTADVITETFKAAEVSGAALACAPVSDTIKKKKGTHLETIPRAHLWLAHTPQTFRTDLILQAHKKALEDGFDGTDDAALVERLGHPVTIVEDSADNIKITTSEDLDLAEMLQQRR